MSRTVIYCGDHALIELTAGKFCKVDRSDVPRVSVFAWKHSGGYATRTTAGGGSQGMHVLIMGHGDKREVDHINGDGLDNRRCNLRLCTRQQNSFNTKARGGSSVFKGVCWDKFNRKWLAHIRVDGVKKSLGRYADEKIAALMYNIAAHRYFGEFARYNNLAI